MEDFLIQDTKSRNHKEENDKCEHTESLTTNKIYHIKR